MVPIRLLKALQLREDVWLPTLICARRQCLLVAHWQSHRIGQYPARDALRRRSGGYALSVAICSTNLVHDHHKLDCGLCAPNVRANNRLRRDGKTGRKWQVGISVILVRPFACSGYRQPKCLLFSNGHSGSSWSAQKNGQGTCEWTRWIRTNLVSNPALCRTEF